jgi:hypothetical protein
MVRGIAAALLLAFGTSALAADVVVERRTSTGGIILRDAVAGGLVGSAVSGGIILYEMGINDNEDYNWQRTLAWGSLIGLGAGLLWGVVDATTGGPVVAMGPPPVRDGLSMSLDTRRRDQSGKEVFPLLAGRF